MPRIHEVVPVTAGLAMGMTFIVIFSFLLYQSPSSNNRMIHSSKLSTVIIPEGAISFHGNFEPDIIIVVLGQNNTVRWLNKDSIPISVVASSYDDPGFHNATHDDRGDVRAQSFLNPNQSFEYTFTKVGVFDYHGVPRPWMRGTVIVLEPGILDNISKNLIEERLRQKIEGVPLTVYVGNTDRDDVKPLHGGSLPLYAIQGFVIDEPTNLISTYQINPNWNESNVTEDIIRNSETMSVLKDRNGNSIDHKTIFSNETANTLSTIDAVCPSTSVTFGDDGTTNQTGTNKESSISYGSKVMISLDNNASSVMFYEYSLGEIEPVAYGFYRLMFVSPYEASIRLSDELRLVSNEQSGCKIVGGREGETTLPYYDIIFELDEKGIK